MSKRKDKERAKQFIHRDGRMIPRAQWDKHQKELRETAEAQRLAKIGLVRSEPTIMTPDQIWKERRPVDA